MLINKQRPQNNEQFCISEACLLCTDDYTMQADSKSSCNVQKDIIAPERRSNTRKTTMKLNGRTGLRDAGLIGPYCKSAV